MKKTAIITGGSKGIGFAIARKLGLDGFNIVIVAVSAAESNRERLCLLDKDGVDYLYISGDVQNAFDRQRVVDMTVEKYGAIHVLVNNAGVAPLERHDLLDMTEESFDRVIGINTKANMFLTQLAARQMLKQESIGAKRGTIINISSCSANVSSVNRGEYCVSKAGVSMLTQLYADRLAAENIYVHEIRPGVIATDMTNSVREKYDSLIASGTFPIARWGTPEDVADVAAVFASDTFLYTTGNYVDVDGGFHIRRL